jgi:hypothetical protein
VTFHCPEGEAREARDKVMTTPQPDNPGSKVALKVQGNVEKSVVARKLKAAGISFK